MTTKTKIIVANVLIIFGFLCLASGIVMLSIAANELFGIIVMFATGLVCLLVGGILWIKSGHPIVEQSKASKPRKNKKRRKAYRVKEPFISDEEWREQEEEDDEMMFIEEVVEDD